jgi:hypothetical protein
MAESAVNQVVFNPSIAYIRRDDLATLINSFDEVSSLKEIYNMWYNNTQITGGTDCWIYYAYSNIFNEVLYITRKIQFLSNNDGTYEWIDQTTTSTNAVSVTSNGLSVADLTEYTSFYTGLEPFKINMSSTSMNIIKTLLNKSGYSLYNYIKIFNIWYNEKNAFDMDYDNTIRVIDVWVYVLTDETAMEDILEKHATPINPITQFDENQITLEMLKPYLLEGGNVQPIFETRKMTYTVDKNNASYTWTVYTNEIVESSINDTGYSTFSSVDKYKLSYFYLDSYTLLRDSSKTALKGLFTDYHNSTQKLKKVNEVWYNLMDINSTVANDNEGPLITILGDNPVSIIQNSVDSYREIGVVAIDNTDSDVTEQVTATYTNNATNTTESSIDISNVGEYTVTYTVQDGAGNISIGTRDVNIIADTVGPVLTIFGDNPTQILIDSIDTYTDAGAVAIDYHSGDITDQIVITNIDTVDITTIGAYTITYTVQDGAGNSVTAYRIVNVADKLDLVPPVITLNGNRTKYVVGNSVASYTDTEGATATDNKDASVTVTTTGTVDMTVPGTYELTYTAQDSAGNTTTAIRTIYVIEEADSVPPTITLNGNSTIELAINGTYSDQGATATDNKDESVTVTVSGDTVDTSTVGTYTITYVATDNAGNISVRNRIVNVVLTGEYFMKFMPTITSESVVGDYKITPAVSTSNGISHGLLKFRFYGIDGNITLFRLQDIYYYQSGLSGDSVISIDLYFYTGITSQDGVDSRIYNISPGIHEYQLEWNGSTQSHYLDRETNPTAVLTSTRNLSNVGGIFFWQHHSWAGESHYGNLFITNEDNGESETINFQDYSSGSGQTDLQFLSNKGIMIEGTGSSYLEMALIDVEPSGSTSTESSTYTPTVTDGYLYGSNSLTVQGVNIITSSTIGPIWGWATRIGNSMGNNAYVHAGGPIYKNPRLSAAWQYVCFHRDDNYIKFTYFNIVDGQYLNYKGAYIADVFSTTTNLDDYISAFDFENSIYFNNDSLADPEIFSTGNVYTLTALELGTLLFVPGIVIMPVLTLDGDNPYFIVKDSVTSYTDPGCQASGGETITQFGDVNINVVGEYKRTYTATDSQGNSTTIIRKVYVIENPSPLITITGSNPVEIILGSTYVDEGATASVNEDGTVSVVSSGDIINENSEEGEYTVTYTATDNAGNVSTATRTVIVVGVVYSYSCFYISTNVSVVDDNGNKFVFNGDTTYNANKKYGLGTGTYTIKNIPPEHPMAILNNGKEHLIRYTGDDANKSSKSVTSTTADGTYDFYHGDITVTVIGNFSTLSIYCYNHGYMGGEKLLIYKQTCQVGLPKDLNIKYTLGLYKSSTAVVSGTKYMFNGHTTYNSKYQYGLATGTYIIKNIPEEHPMAILNAGKTLQILYSGDSTKKISKSVTSTTANGTYDFYHGDITIMVNSDFDKVSIYCYNHGYMGGENLLVYSANCKIAVPLIDNSSLSLSETTITTLDVGIKIYGRKKGYDEDGTSITSGDIYNKLDVNYNKNTRQWNTIINTETLTKLSSGIEDGLSSNNYFQIYHNIDYNLVQRIVQIKEKYNETYGEEIGIVKFYESDLIDNAHILDCYMKFYLLSNPISELYTSLEYDRVINSWKVKKANEVYNSGKTTGVKYSVFRLTHLNNKGDDLKEKYNIVYPLHSIIQIYKLWYDSSSTGNEIVEGLMFYSYKEKDDVFVKTQFATVNILYTVMTDTFAVMSETPIIRAYNYIGEDL